MFNVNNNVNLFKLYILLLNVYRIRLVKLVCLGKLCYYIVINVIVINVIVINCYCNISYVFLPDRI